MKIKVQKCEDCPFFRDYYGHGTHEWDCEIGSPGGYYGDGPLVDIPPSCPLIDDVVTVKLCSWSKP
jgi:hypothetical protein